MAALKLGTIAEGIRLVQAKIAGVKETLKPLQGIEDNLYEAMLRELRTKRLDGFKTDDGTSFTRSYRKGYSIVDERKALDWAVKNNCAKVDTTRLGKMLEGRGAIPEGIEYKETEYLAVRTAKEKV